MVVSYSMCSTSHANSVPRKNLELETIIMHEDYDSTTTQHDIALLKLKEPVDLSVRRTSSSINSIVQNGKVYTPACLPDSGVDFTGETAWVYGWGSTEMGGNIADTLRFFTSLCISSDGVPLY